MRRPLLETPTRTASGAVIGRPRKLAPRYTPWPIRQEPPANIQDFLRERAAQGDCLVLIAHKLGTNDDVLERWMQEDRNLRWAYRVGMAEHEHRLMGLLVRNGLENERTNTNVLAILNRRHGWRYEAPDSGSRVAVMINLPGSRPLSDFIEVSADASGDSSSNGSSQHHGLPAPGA